MGHHTWPMSYISVGVCIVSMMNALGIFLINPGVINKLPVTYPGSEKKKIISFCWIHTGFGSNGHSYANNGRSWVFVNLILSYDHFPHLVLIFDSLLSMVPTPNTELPVVLGTGSD